MHSKKITLKNVKVHNLKNIDLTLPQEKLIVFSGVSGSGKSSMAFDTIYVEGQRRYIESLTSQARLGVGEMKKPDLEKAEGITPTISIEQKTAGKNPRSTVGTMTEIYDYLRVLFARVATPYCPISGEKVQPQSKERIIKVIQALPKGKKLIILAPFAKEKKGEFKEEFLELQRKGFTRVRVDGSIYSLADTLALDGSRSHTVEIVIDRIQTSSQNHSRISEAVTIALQEGKGLVIVLDAETEEETLFSEYAYSPASKTSYGPLEPQDFSFNSPSGMCLDCHGLGQVIEFDLNAIIDPEKSITENCCLIASDYETVRYGNIYNNLADIYDFDIHTPWKKLPERAKKVFLYGTEKKWTRMRFVHPTRGIVWWDLVRWQGVLHEAKNRYTQAKTASYKRKMEHFLTEKLCPTCQGEKLKAYPKAAKLNGKTIGILNKMTIEKLHDFFESLTLTKEEFYIAKELIKEILTRLKFLKKVGLEYLTLERTQPTLSGGEAQRVRLASQIGIGLSGVTYILDEPSIGLHPKDNSHLIETLCHLRDKGNTIIVVEHDEETLRSADHIVDFGPGAGSKGGEVLVSGSLNKLLACKTSITSQYLTKKKTIESEIKKKPGKHFLTLIGATHHNLKNVRLKIPLGLFVAITGVSGSGKSSLVTETLYPALARNLHRSDQKAGSYQKLLGLDAVDKVIAIDQSPIGRNPRSNPATYIKLFDAIRDLFSQLKESQAQGFDKGQFSFNVKTGSCPACYGMGMQKIDMDFLEDAWITCSTCDGKRFDEETLSVSYKGKTIYDVLEMEVDQAFTFFQAIPSIRKKLETLRAVGLNYIKLGQPSTTLSGGEAQRVKLAKELVRPATGKTVYILDEPTTGLHFHDINQLLKVLHTLTSLGNTVIVIEHNIDVIKTADWIVDIGPQAGEKGGEIIATGSPEKVAKQKTATGRALSEPLKTHKAGKEVKKNQAITVKGAEQNNLKRVDLEIPRGKITVCTGPSGSGKSSFAFDTLYAEGQRRYVESLSPYARQFVKEMPKPKVEEISGLCPAIAIEQKKHAGNPRSTVGTQTEIYDYLRILWAHLGVAYCPETGEKITSIEKSTVADVVMNWDEGEKIQILAPLELKKGQSFKPLLTNLSRQGFLRIRLNGKVYDIDQDIPFEPKQKNALFLVIDRLIIKKEIKKRLLEAIGQASLFGQEKLVIQKGEQDHFFNLSFAVLKTGKSYPPITPKTFAFNLKEGMCHDCQGLGVQWASNIIERKEMQVLSSLGLFLYFCGDKATKKAVAWTRKLLEKENIDPDAPIYSLSYEQRNLLFNGSTTWHTLEKNLKLRFIGINPTLAKLGKCANTEIKASILPLLNEITCPSCQGSRLNPLAEHVEVNGMPLHMFCRLPLKKALSFMQSLSLRKQDKKILEDVLKEIQSKLLFLIEMGMHYLSLERKAPTLSGGESQRIRLAKQLGSGLNRVLYVLDEPTSGLHPKDNARLNQALLKLKALGNTLVLVEHDKDVIAISDKVIDFGPKSGALGGHITASGTLKELMKNKASLTGQYFSGKKKITIPLKRRPINNGKLTIQNASVHNLKNINCSIPLKTMTTITGVSGSGKSSLIFDLLLPALKAGIETKNVVTLNGVGSVEGIDKVDKILSIDQNPIGHTVRSDVCTYVDLLTPMRSLFAQLPKARTRGLLPKHFSTNHRKGMCTHCWGLGYKKIEMLFLPPVKVPCQECGGLRLNPISLEVIYHGKNLGEWLHTTVDQARLAFEAHPKMVRILDTLISVGLGYLKLGQEMVSLSGGEAQRIKLSRELSKRSTGNTIYLLDEPTTGLHPDDINTLLIPLQKLVTKGNTLVIIEHHLAIVQNSDWVIELGPEAGDEGGEVIYAGRPKGM